jgi:cyclic pyranopterin phosphate synthase
MDEDLSHVGTQGRARMVDVGSKTQTSRTARAVASVIMQPATLKRIREGGIAKGDVLAVAQVAGIMAAKKTPELIPMCHPIPLDAMDIKFIFQGEDTLIIEAEASAFAKTGVEMESMTAASVAALTVYDMCKGIDRAMTVSEVKLLYKAGGKSGTFVRE